MQDRKDDVNAAVTAWIDALGGVLGLVLIVVVVLWLVGGVGAYGPHS
jgi:hypothetical protein